MLKKMICILLMAAMLLAVSACGTQDMPNENEQAEYTDYTEQAVFSETGWRNTVVYLVSDDGFIVPVMKRIPWEEGIARAAIEQLVATDENLLETAKRGLNPTVPNGTEVEISIKDGCATANLLNFEQLSTAEQEKNMLVSIVNTLTEFESIDRVTVKVNGKSGKLANGTELPEELSRLPLNISETVEASASGDTKPVTLFFANESCSLNIPITRYMSEPTFEKAVMALLAGDSNEEVKCCFPEGTVLISAEISNNTATVNLSSDFNSVEFSPGVDIAAYETLFLTACGFGEISELVLLVDGMEFSKFSSETVPPKYVNEF